MLEGLRDVISLDHLRRIAAWSHELSEPEAERARRGVIEKTYAKGAFICHQGDRFECWAGVVSGLIKVATMSDSGKQVTLAGVPESGWFGEGSVLKHEPRRYDLVALRETRLALMDAATFYWLYEHSVGFNRFLVCQLNERVGHFIGQVENDRMLDAPARVARALATIFNPALYPGVGQSIAITQEEIGLLSGLSRQVTNQALKMLEAAGVLTVGRGGVVIRDRTDLLAYRTRE